MRGISAPGAQRESEGRNMKNVLLIVMLLLVSLVSFAQTTTEPEPYVPTLTAEEQQLVDAFVKYYLATKLNSHDVIDVITGRLQTIETNSQQWVTSAKAAETAAKASADLAAQYDKNLVTIDQKLTDMFKRLAALEAAANPAPVPTTKTILAWKASATGALANLNGATITGGVIIETAAANLAAPIGVKSVQFYLDASTTAHTELTAPYGYKGDNFSAFFTAGQHTLKQVVTFTDGATETVTATFTAN
jgi:predicted transposase YbfD/YdcC